MCESGALPSDEDRVLRPRTTTRIPTMPKLFLAEMSPPLPRWCSGPSISAPASPSTDATLGGLLVDWCRCVFASLVPCSGSSTHSPIPRWCYCIHYECAGRGTPMECRRHSVCLVGDASGQARQYMLHACCTLSTRCFHMASGAQQNQCYMGL